MNKLINEKNNVEWLYLNCHNLYITNPSENEPIKNHLPKDMAKWAETSLNILARNEVSDEDINLTLVPNTVQAKHLLPFQSRIRASKSLYEQITNKWDMLIQVLTKQELTTKDKEFPILTCSKKYIIDGHHRWSQFMISNPEATINVLDITPYRRTFTVPQFKHFYENFDEVFRDYLVRSGHLQLLNQEEFDSKETRKNSLRMTEKETKEYIEQYITEESIQLLCKYNKITEANKILAVDYFMKNLYYFITFVK